MLFKKRPPKSSSWCPSTSRKWKISANCHRLTMFSGVSPSIWTRARARRGATKLWIKSWICVIRGNRWICRRRLWVHCKWLSWPTKPKQPTKSRASSSPSRLLRGREWICWALIRCRSPKFAKEMAFSPEKTRCRACKTEWFRGLHRISTAWAGMRIS